MTAVKSKRFNIVRQYYESGLWKINRVRNAVVKGWITTGEYEEITGERYDN